MTASFDPSGYTAECQLRRRDAQIDGFDPPAGSFSTLQSNDEIADATQGALEGKIISILARRSSSRRNKRPAANVANSGRSAESPMAIKSGLTK
jgi:hypothetical protein